MLPEALKSAAFMSSRTGPTDSPVGANEPPVKLIPGGDPGPRDSSIVISTFCIDALKPVKPTRDTLPVAFRPKALSMRVPSEEFAVGLIRASPKDTLPIARPMAPGVGVPVRLTVPSGLGAQ